MDQVEKVQVNETEIESLLPAVYRKLEWLEKEDLIKRMVSLELNRLINYYQDANDIKTIDGEQKKDRRDISVDNGVQGPEAGYAKLFIGLGKMDGITPKNLMDLINDYVDGRVQIGKIDFFTRYSLFDVEEASAKKVVTALRELDFLGRNVKVEFATEEQIARGTKDRADSAGDRGGYKGRRDDSRSGSNYRSGRSEGGYKGGNYKGRSTEGGYKGRSSEGGYKGNNSEGGYKARSSEGGYKGNTSEGSYKARKTEGGYKPRSESTYGPKREGSGEGGYTPRAEGSSSYGSKREGGFGGDKKSFEAKPYRAGSAKPSYPGKYKGYTGNKNKDGFKKKRY